MSTEATNKPVYNLKNPFYAHLIRAHDLTGPGAAKNTRHYEIDLSGSGMEFIPGDSLAVLPTNDPNLIDSLLTALNFTGDEVVENPKGEQVPLRQALFESYSITEVDTKLLRAIAEKTGHSALATLVQPDQKLRLKDYLWGKDVLDIIQEHPGNHFEAAEFVSLLRRLNIRLYSISSSLAAHPEQVHLTVATVRYESQGRLRGGVCSTFLADRIDETTKFPTFIKAGAGFRLPAPEDETPVIFCGPGTGIAPFRAFLQERKATGAKGKAWLFFGEINRATCFFYEDEFNAYLADGTLSKLDVAFSRDQEQKLYVQHKMLENSKELFEWLEAGAIFYICGDASRMAVDVDNALREIVAKEGGKSPEEVDAYMENLKKSKRYRKDVY
jgi:sulfite reductase (NADPH) flavoprotein alpha-component